VFDQGENRWCRWTGSAWETLSDANLPVITHPHFTGTGTRTIRDNSREELQRLFDRSFTS
jgi:carbamoylphosphate synthase large subunit